MSFIGDDNRRILGVVDGFTGQVELVGMCF